MRGPARRAARVPRGAMLAAALCLVGALAAGGCRPPVRGNGLNVLLVTFETTRADHVGAYGYERNTTPVLDRLAAGGALFENASSASPRTNPSLASLMTSRYPHEHGVRNLLLPLEPEHRTLAEVLDDAGYDTGAVQTHPRLIASSGLAQGFRSYADDYAAHPLAVQAVDVAVEWIDGRASGDRPWFLWLHLMDPHWTYDPPPGWRTAFGPDDPRPGRLYRAVEQRRERVGRVVFENDMAADEVAAFVNFYDAEILYTDYALGGLLAALDSRGLRERTLIVVSADHGESLGEHDYFFEHGDFGTQPEIHVPLVFVAPGAVPAGGRVPWSVSQLDVAPTIVDLLELGPQPAFRGHSLRPLIERPAEGADRRCFGETGKRFHEENTRREVEGVAGKRRWLREGRFKLVHVPRAEGPPERLLYDLVTDPGESRDRAAEHPEVAARLGAALDAWIAEDVAEERDYHVTPELREVLRSLGYVD